MPYTVTIRHADTHKVLDVATCPDLPSALRAKSRAFRSYHHNDLGGQVVVPATMDFDDWDDIDRLRNGNRGPFVPVHVSIDETVEQTCPASASGTSPTRPVRVSPACSRDPADRDPR